MRFLKRVHIYRHKPKLVIYVLLAFMLFIQAPKTYASSDTRSISFHNVNTKQKLTVTYKVNGRNVPAAMRKIDIMLRDWRTNSVIRMNPKLIDTLWSLHRELGSRREIRVISAYRSPKTNAQIRGAKKSKHMLGDAIDVYFPDVSLRTLREAGLLKRVGGVGYYPRSGIPFVHIDIGAVRHWPRMNATQLAALFKRGKPFGGYVRKPERENVTVAAKSTPKKPKPKPNKPIVLANVSKPIKRPMFPSTPIFPSVPIVAPTIAEAPKLRPSISDPELLTEQIILASLFTDEEDDNLLAQSDAYLPIQITTDIATKQNLSFYPVRDFPDLERLEVPISIGFSNNDAYRLITEKPNRFVAGFKI